MCPPWRSAVCSRGLWWAQRPMRTTPTQWAESTVGRSLSTAVMTTTPGAGNKQATQQAISNDAALVGDFSTFDGFGGVLLAENPDVPDVSVVLDHTTNSLPNVVSPVPLRQGWLEGPLQYFKKKFPTGVKAVGVLVADLPSSEAQWQNEKFVMQKVGYRVAYDQTYDESQFDFTQNVITMRNQGVKVLFIDQMPEIYASSLLKLSL